MRYERRRNARMLRFSLLLIVSLILALLPAAAFALPSEVEVTVYKEGREGQELVGTYILKALDGWKLEIPDMDKNCSSGEPYIYTVVETSVDGYTTTIYTYNDAGPGDDYSFFVVNTEVKKPGGGTKPTDPPATGPAITPTGPAITPTGPAITPTGPAITPTDPEITATEPAIVTPKPPPRPGGGGTLVPGDSGKYIELDDAGVPLGEWSWDEEQQTWIFDEYPPLSDIPQTGESDWLFLLLFPIGMLMAGYILTWRRTE